MSNEELRSRFKAASAGRPTEVAVPMTSSPSVSEEKSPVSIGKLSKRVILPMFIVIAVLGLAGAGYAYFRPSHPPKKSTPLGQSISQLVSIPAYYPQNLPSGYSYNNDARTIKTNVLYLSVTGPGKQTFYITQQSVPASFDFVGFDKKFLNPDNFSSDAGSAIAGQVGANLIGSIQTNKNTWIIINSAGTNSLTELETVARSFELAH